jgi:O-antigen/teichoic acid export membrane protein
VVAMLPPDARGIHEQQASLLDTLRIAAGGPLLAAALVVVTLAAIVSGLAGTLIPLRMGDEGYSPLAISVVLGLAGVAAAATQLTLSRTYERFGGVRIALVSLPAMAIVTCLLAVPEAALAMAVIYVVGAPAVSGLYAVAFPLATAGADEVRLPHGIVLGAVNLCWGFGFMVGPAGGAAIAEATSDRVSYLTVTVLALLALPLLRSLALQPRECQEPA